jgi:hypothetical protein
MKKCRKIEWNEICKLKLIKILRDRFKITIKKIYIVQRKFTNSHK